MTLRRILLPALLVVLAAVSGAQVRQPPAFPAASRSPDLGPYRGPGMWVDVYDKKALSDPARAAATMAAHGIRTLYLQTGNWKRPFAVVHPGPDAAPIEAAHARGLKVVTWYLPEFADVDTDLRRVMRSIQFETPNGQRADSFALDIEAPEVEPTTRIQNLLSLSARIRARVGPGYALGAIIPSPRGMIRVPDYWPGFPYRQIPDLYDVILPMSYYTFHYDGAGAAHRYIADNVRIIRQQTGRPDVPIHPIGGLTADTSQQEAQAVVHAARERGVTGVSLYEYGDMTAAQWAELARMPVQPGVRTGSPASLPSAAAVGPAEPRPPPSQGGVLHVRAVAGAAHAAVPGLRRPGPGGAGLRELALGRLPDAGAETRLERDALPDHPGLHARRREDQRNRVRRPGRLPPLEHLGSPRGLGRGGVSCGEGFPRRTWSGTMTAAATAFPSLS
ncbi:MAG: hypothetical protein ACJ77A_00995 [Actinomycetota bacterium]